MDAQTEQTTAPEVAKEQKVEEVEKQDDNKEVDGEQEEENAEVNEDTAAEYLKDYESLLKYTLKLLGDNKYLMQENLKVRLEAEEMVKMNLKLLQENEKIKAERDKLLSDSMTLIEYNDYLQSSKDSLEKDLLDIKEKFYSILSGMQDLNENEQAELDAIQGKEDAGEDKGAST